MPYAVERPRPVPLPTSFVVKNGSKTRRRVSRVHPDARVGDLEHDVRSRHELGGTDGRPPFVHPRVGRADGEVAAVRHRVSRVDHEIHEHPLDLSAIAHDGRHHRRGLVVDHDAIANQAPKHRQQILDEIVQVERRRLHHLPAAEGEQLFRQVGRAIGGLLDLGDLFLAPVAGELHGQPVRVPENGRQEVVEVMGHAAGELADGLHLLALP